MVSAVWAACMLTIIAQNYFPPAADVDAPSFDITGETYKSLISLITEKHLMWLKLLKCWEIKFTAWQLHRESIFHMRVYITKCCVIASMRKSWCTQYTVHSPSSSPLRRQLAVVAMNFPVHKVLDSTWDIVRQSYTQLYKACYRLFALIMSSKIWLQLIHVFVFKIFLHIRLRLCKEIALTYSVFTVLVHLVFSLIPKVCVPAAGQSKRAWEWGCLQLYYSMKKFRRSETAVFWRSVCLLCRL